MTASLQAMRPAATFDLRRELSWEHPTTTWGDVRLWVIDLDDPACRRSVAGLSALELRQADRFAFSVHARRYRAAHALLRKLLQAGGVVRPGEEFVTGAQGKPRLTGTRPCAFNVSHSGNRALIGIGGDSEIGVDIELPHRLPDMHELAQQHFTESERDALRGMAPGADERAFLTVWTRKEACLKALGSGLTIAPETFHVGADTSPRDVVVSTSQGLANVRVESLDFGCDIVAAVAMTARAMDGRMP